MKRIFFLMIAMLVFASVALAGVNINAASQKELESLPGIGPSKAIAIIEYRNAKGGFTSVDQLDDVPGIGPATMANLRPLVELGDGIVSKSATDETSDDSTPAATVSSGSGGARINVNTASASEIERLPGIGAGKAAAIAADRAANGPFASCDELRRVKGVGEATLAGLRDFCTTE